MSLNNQIAELARVAIGVNAADLPTIIALREGLLDLAMCEELPCEAPAGDLIAQGASTLESIVLRELDNADGALVEINGLLDYLQLVAEALEDGARIDTIPTPKIGAGTLRHAAWCEVARSNESADDAGASGAEVVATHDDADAGEGFGAQREGETDEPALAETHVDPTGDGERVILEGEMDDTLREFIGEAVEHLQNAEAALLQLESDPSDGDLVNTVFRAFHTIKGVAGYLNLQPIVELSHSAEFLLDGARSNSLDVSPGFIELALRTTDVLGELVASFEGGKPPLRKTFDQLLTALESALKEGFGESSGLPSAAAACEESRAQASGSDAGARASSDDTMPPNESASTQPRESARSLRTTAADHTVRVSTNRLDGLIDMVGELVIRHQMVVQDPVISTLDEQRTRRTLGQVGKIIRDLQELAMSLRMVTLRGPFQKMTRLVRDLSKKAGKDILIQVEGEDTELDRNVVEEIGDPLMHMVRNACDHGIETPEARYEAGKPEQGTLTLRAYHKGGAIVLEVQDDGKGLDREKLIAKAVERGVIGSDKDPSEMSDAEVYNLIFVPGFSTAETVTDVSGRGVGMDVVRRNIEALRGSIEIRSEKGKGSIFVLSLPLKMAIIDGMVVRIGD